METVSKSLNVEAYLTRASRPSLHQDYCLHIDSIPTQNQNMSCIGLDRFEEVLLFVSRVSATMGAMRGRLVDLGHVFAICDGERAFSHLVSIP